MSEPDPIAALAARVDALTARVDRFENLVRRVVARLGVTDEAWNRALNEAGADEWIAFDQRLDDVAQRHRTEHRRRSEAEWRPPLPVQIEAFHAAHAGHRVHRRDEPYTDTTIWSIPGLRERWNPGAVFVVLRCVDCRQGLVLDIVSSAPE